MNYFERRSIMSSNPPDIIFPNIGIEFSNINEVAFRLFGRIDIYWYGIIICTGIVAGLMMAVQVAKRDNQDSDVYYEMLFYTLISAIVGARLYYVIFSWENYKDNLLQIFNLRTGGLAIYGGVIGAVIAAIVFARVKKLNQWVLLDTGATGLILGQAIGRWGNFINKEAFGGYTNTLFAMQIKASEASLVPIDPIMVNGEAYIQVHPTFLYESMWNLAVLIALLLYFKHKRFNGEIFYLYLLGYGLGRVWIEGLRTDQLIIGNTGIPVSQLLAGILIVASLSMIVISRKRLKRRDRTVD